MDFFQILSQIGAGIDISIRIKEKDGILSVMVTPEAGNKTRLDGKILTGTAQEIDNSFFVSITPVLDHAKGVIAQDVKAAEEVKKEEKPQPAKSDATAAKNKGTKDKKGKQAKPDKKKTAPAVQERSMFDEPADPLAAAGDEMETEAPEDEQPDTDDETDSETE
jgi:PRTRC system protein E